MATKFSCVPKRLLKEAEIFGKSTSKSSFKAFCYQIELKRALESDIHEDSDAILNSREKAEKLLMKLGILVSLTCQKSIYPKFNDTRTFSE